MSSSQRRQHVRISWRRHVFSRPGFWIGVLLLPLILPAAAFGDFAGLRVPAGVSYTEPLAEGEWMLSYQYERQLQKRLNRLNPEYDQIPIEQDIDIHTLAVEWAPFKRLTVSIALPILVQRMKQLDPGAIGGAYTSKSSGPGDLKIMTAIPFIKKGNESLDFHVGLNIPIDSSNQKKRQGESLPFSMQSDSSSWNIIAGLTYKGGEKCACSYCWSQF